MRRRTELPAPPRNCRLAVPRPLHSSAGASPRTQAPSRATAVDPGLFTPRNCRELAAAGELGSDRFLTAGDPRVSLIPVCTTAGAQRTVPRSPGARRPATEPRPRALPPLRRRSASPSISPGRPAALHLGEPRLSSALPLALHLGAVVHPVAPARRTPAMRRADRPSPWRARSEL